MRKLFKGGNYSRAETIWGNTVFPIYAYVVWCPTWSKNLGRSLVGNYGGQQVLGLVRLQIKTPSVLSCLTRKEVKIMSSKLQRKNVWHQSPLFSGPITTIVLETFKLEMSKNLGCTFFSWCSLTIRFCFWHSKARFTSTLGVVHKLRWQDFGFFLTTYPPAFTFSMV